MKPATLPPAGAVETTRTDQVTPAFFVASDLRRWTGAFLTAKRAEAVSPNTLQAYRKALDGFLTWADARNLADPAAVTADDLRQFFLVLADRGHNPGGVHIYFRVLRTFFFWWAAEDGPAGWRNPFDRLKPPKLPEEPLDAATLDDITRLLKAAPGGRQGERDRAAVLTLLDTGLRASEFCALNLDDLDPMTGAVTVRHGKGGKSRAVFLGASARRAVRAWLKVRQGDGPALFTTEQAGRLTYSGLRQIVRRLAQRAGVPEPPLHSFRRAFAINALRNGADLLTLQRLLGHSDLSLLRKYAKQSVDDLRAVHAAVSPADRAGL